MSMALERTTLVAAVAGFGVVLLLDVLLRAKDRPAWPAVSGGLLVVLGLLTAAEHLGRGLAYRIVVVAQSPDEVASLAP